MSTIDWSTWLGPAVEEMSDEQRVRFEDEAEIITARYADPDLSHEAEVALTALVQYLLGETTIDEAGALRTRTRDAAADAYIAAQVVARLSVLDGMAEAEAGRRASLDRMTVRKMLGKR